MLEQVFGVILGTGFDPKMPGLEDQGVDHEMSNTLAFHHYKLPRQDRETSKMIVVVRHGINREYLAHSVPYKEIAMDFSRQGVKKVIATSAVGSLRQAIILGSIVLPIQQIDITGQVHTVFTDGSAGGCHKRMAQPYCGRLRQSILKAARIMHTSVREGGCYFRFMGAQLETEAEIRMARALGGDLVGMTVTPEAKLFRDLGICYQPICLVTNLAAGMGDDLADDKEIERRAQEEALGIKVLITIALGLVGECKEHSVG
jgi:5'-methylthioadenosine phosphorylase